jgi:hypothetical protein
MLRIARRALVAPCTALRYIGNRNGSEITTMRGKQSRGWIDLLLRNKQVDEHDLARGGPGVIVSFDLLTLTASELEREHLRLFQNIGAGLIAGGVI